MEGVDGEVDVGQIGDCADVTVGAVGECEGAEVADGVAVGQEAAVFCIGDGDGGDAEFGECLEFALLRNGVLVEVLPDAQGCEAGVECIDQAIAIGVQLGEKK